MSPSNLNFQNWPKQFSSEGHNNLVTPFKFIQELSMTILEFFSLAFLDIYNSQFTIAILLRHLLLFLKFRINCQIWQPVDHNIAAIKKIQREELFIYMKIRHAKNWMSSLYIRFLIPDHITIYFMSKLSAMIEI